MPPHELRWYACCSDVCCARLSTKGNPERQPRTERRAHIRGGLHSRSASYTAAAAPRMQETSGLVATELNGMRNLRLVSSRERRLSADRRRFARGDGRRAIDRVMITPATPSCDGCGSLTGPYWVSGTGRFDDTAASNAAPACSSPGHSKSPLTLEHPAATTLQANRAANRVRPRIGNA